MHQPGIVCARYSPGLKDGGVWHRPKQYSGYEQSVQHQPDHAIASNNLGVEGGGVVAGTAYKRSML